jgi:hypothetical protein
MFLFLFNFEFIIVLLFSSSALTVEPG